MKKIIKKQLTGVDKDKKQTFRNSMGSAASTIDFNKVRDEWKYAIN